MKDDPYQEVLDKINRKGFHVGSLYQLSINEKLKGEWVCVLYQTCRTDKSVNPLSQGRGVTMLSALKNAYVGTDFPEIGRWALPKSDPVIRNGVKPSGRIRRVEKKLRVRIKEVRGRR